ncbi:hypothetical protein HALDL1_05260 [Halobacterium sp. DL1]|nr:hypothetical protein HALDL1_05260 [Halobacterium sp. DL1]
MHLCHERNGESRTLAHTVDTADSFISQTLGLMFRTSMPQDYALVFPFDKPAARDAHMVFVPFDIDAVWVEDGEVQQVKRLSAWTGRGEARCDTLVELPAGAADSISVGDRLFVAD